MNSRHLSLFTLRVTHQYYGGDDTACPDFDFVPAQHSLRAMAGARLLCSQSTGQLHVLYEANDNDLPVQDIAGMEVLIGLRLRNPYFEHFTDALPAPLPFYANPAASRTLDAQEAGDLIANRFEPVALLSQRPLTLSIRRMRGNDLMWSGQIKAGENMPVIDMRFWEPGCYLVTQEAGTETRNRPLVLAPDLAEACMWGVVKIVVAAEFWNTALPPEPPDFRIGFDARKETLDYYLVAPKAWTGAFNDLSISDTTSNPALAFNALPQTDISNDGIAPALLGVPKTSQAILFRSTLPVTRSAASSLHIQLTRNGNTLIKNLPLPGADMPLARFIVHLSKP